MELQPAIESSTARDMRKFIQSTDFSNETWNRKSQSRLLLMLLATGLLICTQCTEAHVKESIITSFPALDLNLHVVVATIAFGMANISHVIHWGPSSAIEDYVHVQEICRAGRTAAMHACATLYYQEGDQQLTSAKVMEYCKNRTESRCELLFQYFYEYNRSDAPHGCLCCDLCALKCECVLSGKVIQ